MTETCDRCGPTVRAVTHVELANGVLTFCGHCARQHADALEKLAPA